MKLAFEIATPVPSASAVTSNTPATAEAAAGPSGTSAAGGNNGSVPSPQTLSVANAPPAAAPAAAGALPMIENEASDAINVGAGGTLVVPHEDHDSDLDDGLEIDLVGALPMKIRKPNRREWIALQPQSELRTRMLLHKPKADGMDTEHYYLVPSLRGPVRDELKDVRVFVYFSFTAKCFGLWVVNITLGNSWYESLDQLFKQPAEFFVRNAIRVISDKQNSRNRVRFQPKPSDVAWPTKTTGELLAEAIGQDRFITSPDHPIYRDLIGGVELS